MHLSNYIEHLQDILKEHGDIEHLYTPVDDEGNGYNRYGFMPGVYYTNDNPQYFEEYVYTEDECDECDTPTKVIVL